MGDTMGKVKPKEYLVLDNTIHLWKEPMSDRQLLQIPPILDGHSHSNS